MRLRTFHLIGSPTMRFPTFRLIGSPTLAPAAKRSGADA
jgi:hypothetical protein